MWLVIDSYIRMCGYGIRLERRWSADLFHINIRILPLRRSAYPHFRILSVATLISTCKTILYLYAHYGPHPTNAHKQTSLAKQCERWQGLVVTVLWSVANVQNYQDTGVYCYTAWDKMRWWKVFWIGTVRNNWPNAHVCACVTGLQHSALYRFGRLACVDCCTGMLWLMSL